MANIRVNDLCQIKTDLDTKGVLRMDGTAAPEITVGLHRLRLDMHDARRLAAALTEAIAKVEELRLETPKL